MNRRESPEKGRKIVINAEDGTEQVSEPTEGGETQGKPAEGGEPATPDQLARLRAEKDELMQTLVRRQADFENYRKRIERERQEEGRRGVARLLTDLLPVLDGLELALRAHDDPTYEEYRKGLQLIYRQLSDTLARHGLERIAADGKPFDPYFHQAIEQVETRDCPEGTVVEVLQDGYLFHGRVLRPSTVRVAVSPRGAGGEESPAANRKAN
jgi:molecular chaperone GrpE